MASNNRTIAKNTLYLYIRMLVTMIISLYTSRVILQTLGVDDFGIYQAVGGIVGLLSFLNGALSGGTSRFITYELGADNKENLKNTFTTTLSVHIIIALIVIILGETIGLWYFNNKMVIPAERFNASTVVFHLSMITAVLSITSVPFNASIIAHEKMKIFAYAGIIEAAGKLGIAFALAFSNIDSLVLFAILLLLLQLCLFLFYVLYCRHNFEEANYRSFYIDIKLFKEIFSFSGWSLLANGSIALNNQGVLLLLNLFFAPAVVAARSLSLTVHKVTLHFVQNFRTAANPQIVKLLAKGDVEGSHKLLLQSTKFSYYLMLVLCLPIFLLASPLLNLWLVEVPEYTVPFLQIVIVQSLFQVFDTSFYTALYAKGRIKENALISPTFGFVQFPIVYFLFRMGFPPLALSWASLVTYAIIGCVVKPIMIVKIAGYKWKGILNVLYTCFIVTLLAVPVPLLVYWKLGTHTFLNAIIIGGASLLCVAISVWSVGISSSMRQNLTTTAMLKVHSFMGKNHENSK